MSTRPIARPSASSAARTSCPCCRPTRTRSSSTRCGSSRWLEARRPDPPLWPADPARRAEVDVFVEWFNRVWKTPPNAIDAELGRPRPDRAKIDAWAEEMRGWLHWFEALLEGRDHLMGDAFGAADVAAFPFLKYGVFPRSGRRRAVPPDPHGAPADRGRVPAPRGLDPARRFPPASVITPIPLRKMTKLLWALEEAGRQSALRTYLASAPPPRSRRPARRERADRFKRPAERRDGRPAGRTGRPA